MTVGEELVGPRRVLTLLETAALVGSWERAELDLFEVLGRKSRELPASLSPWAASASRRAAWRAEELAALLPVSRGLPGADELIRPAGPAHSFAAAKLAAAAGDDLLAGVLGFYDSLGSAYEARRALLSEAADGQFDIVLARVSEDLRGDESLLRAFAGDVGGAA